VPAILVQLLSSGSRSYKSERGYRPTVKQASNEQSSKPEAAYLDSMHSFITVFSEVSDILLQASDGEAVAAASTTLSMLVEQQKTLAEQIAALCEQDF